MLTAAQVALEDNRKADAKNLFKRAVRVPEDFVPWLITKISASSQMDLIVAPYEADAQLASLLQKGRIDYVLSTARMLAQPAPPTLP